VVDVFAEDNGLVIAVGGPEKFGDSGGNQLGALFQDQSPVIIHFVVFAVFNQLAVFVGLAIFRPPPFQVAVDADADDFVGREEAIGNALPEGVGVDRVAEILDIGNLPGLLGGGGQANLGGGGKIFQDLAPGRITGGAASVALVHDNEIKKVGRKLLVDVLLFLGAGDRLIEGQ